MGDVYFETKQWDKARREYQRRIDLRPEDALHAHVHLGIIAFATGEGNHGRSHFERAIEISGTAMQAGLQSPSALLQGISLAQLCLGETPRALDTLREAGGRMLADDTLLRDEVTFLAECENTPEGLGAFTDLLASIERQRQFKQLGPDEPNLAR